MASGTDAAAIFPIAYCNIKRDTSALRASILTLYETLSHVADVVTRGNQGVVRRELRRPILAKRAMPPDIATRALGQPPTRQSNTSMGEGLPVGPPKAQTNAPASNTPDNRDPAATVAVPYPQPIDLPLSVILADDNRMFREALLARIRQVVGDVEIREVFTAREIFEDCPVRPGYQDLFLIDMSMPELRGSAGLRDLRRRRPDALIIAIGCPPDPAEARTALEAGVSAYLLRSMGSEAFAAALALVLNGERFFPASVMLEALKLAAQSAAPYRQPPENAGDTPSAGDSLTPRQLMVLRHLAVGKSNKEIARALGIQEITVKVHLQAIFSRIGVSNRTQAAMHAERAGWFTGLTDDADSSDVEDDGDTISFDDDNDDSQAEA
ncbi:MAG: DNA-binding response regulator [Reyranellaceae bacterium]